MDFSCVVIGGTGIGDALISGRQGASVEIAEGIEGTAALIGGRSVLVIPRHGQGHKLPPHALPYTAVARRLAELQVPVCFSTAAVGSLHLDWPVGSIAVCTDFIDVSGRQTTMFATEVRHTDLSVPFPAAPILRSGAERAGIQIQGSAVYVNVNGPRYETPAEIRAFKVLGGDVVGMTAGSEAIAMAEAGVKYGCLALITNLASGLQQGPLDHGAVSAEMEEIRPRVLAILEAAISSL